LGRLVIFDAVPHTLKHRQQKTALRTFLATWSLYLAYLSGVGVIQGQATYTFLTASGVCALAAFNKRMSRQFLVSRVYLLRSGKQIRVENVKGDFTDVAIDHVVLSFTDRLNTTVTLTLEESQSVTLTLRDATYFDPELLYAVSSPVVSEVLPTAQVVTF